MEEDTGSGSARPGIVRLERAGAGLFIALLGAYVASGLSVYSEKIDTRPRTGPCVPCEWLFARLEEAPDGKLQQSSQIELRGEPKSGTRFTWRWAVDILQHACTHLQAMYGSETCRTEITDNRNSTRMVFEPGLAQSDEPCTCEGISRVEVTASREYRHSLPVPASCPWQHRNNIADEGDGCGTVNGRSVENAEDLWLCMEESSCEYSGAALQFAVMRDPRAVAVSTYFHIKKYPEQNVNHTSLGKSIDEAVLPILRQVCQFTTIRHILFDGQLAYRSEIFWYEDAMRDPLDWHYRWASLAGLTLPAGWINDMEATMIKAQRIYSKRDPHQGGQPRSSNRTWQDEVSPEIREEMDPILRTWLPPALLARLDVPA